MTPSIVEFAVKSTAIMAVAAVVAGLMRRRGSAASRHLVWVLAVAGVLILPIASIVVPSWEIPIWRATTAAASVAPIAGVKEFQRPMDAVSGEPIAAAGTSPASVQQTRSPVASISWMALRRWPMRQVSCSCSAGLALNTGKRGGCCRGPHGWTMRGGTDC
jgi:hypothetical protein